MWGGEVALNLHDCFLDKRSTRVTNLDHRSHATNCLATSSRPFGVLKPKPKPIRVVAAPGQRYTNLSRTLSQGSEAAALGCLSIGAPSEYCFSSFKFSLSWSWLS